MYTLTYTKSEYLSTASTFTVSFFVTGGEECEGCGVAAPTIVTTLTGTVIRKKVVMHIHVSWRQHCCQLYLAVLYSWLKMALEACSRFVNQLHHALFEVIDKVKTIMVLTW